MKKHHFYLASVIVLAFICYIPAINCGFTNWDDPKYIIDNPLIKDVSWEGIKRMFTTFVIVDHQYHPLTLLTWGFDYQKFKLNPGPYHFGNIVLHLFNIGWVYILAARLSGKVFVGVLTAAFFAFHPMHVESVAWAAGRKDVLFAFFYLIALWAYTVYAREDGFKKRRFVICTLLFFLLSLLSKPMAISLPLVLFVLDWYFKRPVTRVMFIEKLPFLFLSVTFGLIAMSQIPDGDVVRAVDFSWMDRVFLASFTFLAYLGKLFLPVKQACFYGFPEKVNGSFPWVFYAAPLGVVLICVLAKKLSRTQRYVGFGFLFYSVTIVIVTGIIKMADALMADRYTYISYIGIYYILAEWLYRLFMKNRNVVCVCGIIIITLGYLTYQRVGIWRDDYTLWTDVIKKYPRTALAYNNRGNTFGREEKFDLALVDFNRALTINPRYAQAYNNRALVYIASGQYDSAIKDLNTAIRLKENYYFAYFHRGYVYEQLKQYGAAVRDYNKALAINPKFSAAQYRKDWTLKNVSF